MTQISIPFISESPNTLIRSTRWNLNFITIQNFLDGKNIDSTDNIKDGGVSNISLQEIIQAGLVSGTSLINLDSIPSGANKIPVANIDTGTTANKILKLDSSAKIPAVDGSQITKIDGSNFLNLNNIPTGAGIIPSANLPPSGGGGSAHGYQIFKSNGTFTAPSAITNVFVTAIGGGGGGGRGLLSPNNVGGAGGGGGATLSNNPYTVIPGNNYSVVIGVGGTGGSGGVTDGTDGSDSSFDSAIIAKGGKGALASFGFSGGGTGGGRNNDLFPSAIPGSGILGGDGGSPGFGNSIGSGGGGSSAGSGGSGSPSGAGSSALANSGGGGGGGGSSDQAGGDGGSGLLIVSW